jgi:hypothetical protein
LTHKVSQQLLSIRSNLEATVTPTMTREHPTNLPRHLGCSTQALAKGSDPSHILTRHGLVHESDGLVELLLAAS